MDNGDKIAEAFLGADLGRAWNGVSINESQNDGYTPIDSNHINLNINANIDNMIPCQQDLHQLLPITNVHKIMKNILPLNAKISQDSKEIVQLCASEFITFITSEANDHARSLARRTIQPEDIIYGLRVLGFDNYVGILNTYLNRYRKAENENLQEISGMGNTLEEQNGIENPIGGQIGSSFASSSSHEHPPF